MIMNISDYCKNCEKSFLRMSFNKVDRLGNVTYHVCFLERKMKKEELSEYSRKRAEYIKDKFGYDDIFDKKFLNTKEDVYNEIKKMIDNQEDVCVSNKCVNCMEITIKTLNKEKEKDEQKD